MPPTPIFLKLVWGKLKFDKGYPQNTYKFRVFDSTEAVACAANGAAGTAASAESNTVILEKTLNP